MSRTNSLASSGASRERQLLMNENFRTLPASLGATTATRLEQQRRRLSIRDSNPVISTAISANGWLVAATSAEVRLYELDHQDQAREIKRHYEFSIKMKSKNEKIRSVAISDDLLAVVTHYRLIVFDYRVAGSVENNTVEDVRIDQNETWTPKSVSIMQVESADTRQSAAAWIAVGGEGINGVKLFQYSQICGWDAQRDCRSILKCPGNTSSLRDVGFSQFVRENKFIVFGVTSDNRIFCWDVRPRESVSPVTVAAWELDGRDRQDAPPHRGEISSVSIFESPSGRPYIFCSVDQRHGSQHPRSFIAPIGNAANDLDNPGMLWRTLPDGVGGRHVLVGTVTWNGHFLVMVEEGVIKLLTLRGAYEGGITCQEKTLEWHSSLKGAAKDLSGISLLVREELGRLEIIAVDGLGHLIFTRISVPGMPVSTRPSLTRRSSVMPVELPAEVIVRELSGEEVKRPERSDSKVQSDWDRIEEEIRVILR